MSPVLLRRYVLHITIPAPVTLARPLLHDGMLRARIATVLRLLLRHTTSLGPKGLEPGAVDPASTAAHRRPGRRPLALLAGPAAAARDVHGLARTVAADVLDHDDVDSADHRHRLGGHGRRGGLRPAVGDGWGGGRGVGGLGSAGPCLGRLGAAGPAGGWLDGVCRGQEPAEAEFVAGSYNARRPAIAGGWYASGHCCSRQRVVRVNSDRLVNTFFRPRCRPVCGNSTRNSRRGCRAAWSGIRRGAGLSAIGRLAASCGSRSHR